MSNAQDLVGLTFSRLTVVVRAGTSKHGNVLWQCLCDCGVTKIVKARNLITGDTKSCGCAWRRDRSTPVPRKLPGATWIPVGKGIFAIVDDADAWLKKYNWGIESKGYARAWIDGKHVKMHQLILGVHTGTPDHKNRKPLDNRRKNLRITTPLGNARNRKTPSDNKSGVAGVSWNSAEKIWKVYLGSEYLGRFKNFNAAVKRRQQIEKLKWRTDA